MWFIVSFGGVLVGRDRTIEAENVGKRIGCDAADGCEQGRKWPTNRAMLLN